MNVIFCIKHSLLLPLRTDKSPDCLCIPLLWALITPPAKNGKPLGSQLQLISLTLLHVLGEHILRLLLQNRQMNIEPTGFIPYLLLFSLLFDCFHYLFDLSETAFFCIVYLNALKFVIFFVWICCRVGRAFLQF